MTLTTKKAEQEIAKLRAEVAALKIIVENLIANNIVKNQPDFPKQSMTCSKCGLDLTNITGMVCSKKDCPTFPNMYW